MTPEERAAVVEAFVNGGNEPMGLFNSISEEEALRIFYSISIRQREIIKKQQEQIQNVIRELNNIRNHIEEPYYLALINYYKSL